jgi:ABC-type sulfate transport system substrate-binding protein
VSADLPVLRGERAVVPVIISVGVVHHHQHPDAERFLRFLFTEESQERLAKSYFRPVREGAPDPAGELDVNGTPLVAFDWSTWAQLESKLKDYEVRS